MSAELSGKKIAFLVANEGIEQIELTSPWQAVENAGATPVLIAPEGGKAQAFNHLDRADAFAVDQQTSDAKVDDFDGVVLPGGVANPDVLRRDEAAVRFLADCVAAGKPIAAICHAPWTLVEADVVRGKNLASWPSLRTDIENAGGHWHDKEVVRCDLDGWLLVTSRNPDDLDAFNRELITAFAT